MNTISMTEVTCAICGTIFEMQTNLFEIRQKDGKAFHCPNGHGNMFKVSPECEECGRLKKAILSLQGQVNFYKEQLEAATKK